MESCNAGFAALRSLQRNNFCSIPPRFCASLPDVALASLCVVSRCPVGFVAVLSSCCVPDFTCKSCMPQECFSDLYMDMQICAGAVRQHMDGSQQTATGKGEQHTADLEELTWNCVGHSLVAPSDAESLACLGFLWNGTQNFGLTSVHLAYPVQLGLLATLSRRVSCKEDM